jgi:serine/threonine protein kinase
MKPTAGMTQIMGTPGFMAPEQARFGILSVATDIYGLGITFANALADGNTSNPLFNPDMPDAFRELVWRMVDSEPGKRPAQMKEVLSALEELNQEAG